MTDAPPPPRRFGYWTAHFVVVSSMVGAGILTTSGYTLQATGNPAALLTLWALGGVMALAGALTVAELATALPHAGGDYVFVREGFGRGAGFVAGWATFALGFAGPTAVIAYIALTYLTAPFTGGMSELELELIVRGGATLLVAVVTVTHCLGQRESGRFQAAVTVVNVLLLVGLGVGGALFGRGDWGHLRASAWPPAEQWPALATGLIYVSYSYAGWNGAGYIAGEVRDPARLLPRALVGGTLTVTLLYLLVNAAYVYALDPAVMTTRSEEEVKKVGELAVVELFGRPVANVFVVLVGMSMVAAVSAYILTGPRVTFAMARDGLFPPFAGRLHPTRQVPVWATVAQGVAAAALLWVWSFQKLLDYVSVGLAAVSALVVASVFPLRRRLTDRSFRMPLYPLPPLLYLALIGWTVTSQVLDPKTQVQALLSLGTILIGVPLAALFVRRKPPTNA